MKKLLIILLLFSFVAVSLTAAVGSQILSSILKSSINLANMPTLKSVEINGEEVLLGGISIRKLKKNLQEHDFSTFTHEERVAIYQETHQIIGKSMFRNFLVGFGTGSQKQGDVAGHLTGQIFDWASLTVVGVGAAIALIDVLVMLVLMQEISAEHDELLKTSLYIMAGGAGAFVLGRVVQLILPAIYGGRYNKALREGLYLTKKMGDSTALNFGIEPTLFLAEQPTMGVKLVANLGFTP